MTDRRRALPPVDRLLRQPAVAALAARCGRDLVLDATRAVLADARAGHLAAPGTLAGWASAVGARVAATTAPTLRRVVNATGVVLHTNLGRAPLATVAIDAIAAAATGYATLEYDAGPGVRGSRQVHCAALLTELTGAADAMVVNNAASALVLALAVAAGGGEAVVSRGELIEIGGGFRIPEVLATSGVRLVEVGTTNRTRLDDYTRALGPARVPARGARTPRVLLKVHRSNFRLSGFTAEAGLAELVALGKRRRVPVLYDLGSGLMLDLAAAGLGGEPTLPWAARRGAAAVIVSGDKLLGGPQAGIIVGSAGFLRRCRRHPFARAARADKLTLAGLAATLALYRDPDRARRDIPVLRMLSATAEELTPLAEALATSLPASAGARVIATRAVVGGGAFPDVELASAGIALEPEAPAASELAARLRNRPVPVVGVVARGRVVLDVRTLLPGDTAEIQRAVADAVP